MKLSRVKRVALILITPLTKPLDVGTSKLIADGKIKLKNDSPIEGFSESGLKFKDGSTLPADVVVFATG